MNKFTKLPASPPIHLGADYPTPDGSCIRDYIHVTDLAEAHVLALRYLFERGEATFFNLGTGQGHSVRQALTAVERLSGRKVPVRESARRSGDPPVLVARPEKAANILDWSPRFSKLDEIVRTAWEWRSKHQEYTLT